MLTEAFLLYSKCSNINYNLVHLRLFTGVLNSLQTQLVELQKSAEVECMDE